MKAKGKWYTVFLEVIDRDPDDPPYWAQVRAGSPKEAVGAARVKAAEDFSSGYGDEYEPDADTFRLLMVIHGKSKPEFEV